MYNIWKMEGGVVCRQDKWMTWCQELKEGKVRTPVFDRGSVDTSVGGVELQGRLVLAAHHSRTPGAPPAVFSLGSKAFPPVGWRALSGWRFSFLTRKPISFATSALQGNV